MDDYTLKKVQNEMLIIAKEIKRICEENSIPYYLVGGTLIGAVRHKGFIPWDDDLDIGMFRKDYERFVEIAPSVLKDGFFLQTWNSDEEFGLAFAKVRREGTVFREENDFKIKRHQGFWVDIFPYDNLPNDKNIWPDMSRKIMSYRSKMYIKSGMTIWKRQKNTLRKVLIWLYYFPIRISNLFVSRKELIDKFTQTMTKYNKQNTEYVCQESGGAQFGKYPIKRDYLTECVLLPFEDTEFSCPKEYDAFLRSIYGDYMKLPPEEKRQNYHGIVEVKFLD